MFFFEKKNQKTFVHSSRVFKQAYQDLKVFCFFFSKKKCFCAEFPSAKLAGALMKILHKEDILF